RPSGKMVLEDNAGPYQWIDATVVQAEVVGHGQAAFRSDGNDHFTAELGIAGDYPEQFRYLSLWVLPIGPEADIQIQVRADGDWTHRWGFDAGPKYNGYGWEMKGTTTGLKPGVWQPLRLDLIGDLGINPGQKITGIAFSSDGADVYYDSVYLLPNPSPAVKPNFQPTGKRVLEDDTGGYSWVDATEAQDYLVFSGSRAFKSNGNDHFTADLGVAGNGTGQFRSVGFWAFFMGPEADIQLQVQADGDWTHRWGFDAGPKYNGYGWSMHGTTANMTSGRWTWVQVDLLDQLKLKPGQRITGLAFSSDGADVAYDSVYLLPSGATPGMTTGSSTVNPGNAGYPGGASLRLERDRFAPGESILVHFTAPGGWPDNAWIGIIPSGIPHGDERQNDNHDITYQYLKKRTSGTMTFTAPKAGDWDFRLHDTDSNGKEFASVSFRVGEVTPTGGQTGSPGGHSSPSATPASAGSQSSVSFENGNIGGVSNGPTQPTTFTLNEARILTLIQNYHWNSARGATPGTIALRGSDGRSYGPWQTAGTPGQGGVPNAYWTARPNVILPAGTYTVIDSNPASWSHNSQSGNRGFTRVETAPVGSATPGGRDYTGMAAQGQVIFEVGNIGGVSNGPSRETAFSLSSPQTVTLIRNYHWNWGRGATPGTIALRSSDGRSYGPWPTSGSPGQGGVANAYWTATPNLALPAGTYTVIDSDPATWSHNGESGNRGFTRVEGNPAASVQPAPANGKADDLGKQVEDLFDAVKSLKGLFGN
ncbi:MAG: hypothetical protein WC474_13745, partial [Hydrogenophilaceae bacterium]